MYFVLTLLLVLYSDTSYGSEYSDGDSFGKSLLEDLGVKAGSLNTNDIPHYTNSPKEAALSDEDLEGAKAKAFEDKRNKAVQLVKESEKTRQKNDMKFMDEVWFESSADITKKLEALVSSNCKLDDKKSNNLGPEVEKYIVQVEDYRTIEETKYCEEPVEASFSCNRELTLTCKSSKECNTGGIVADSVASDMKFEYRYPVLTIGTIADNHWSGSCDVYDRSTIFNIKNKQDITEFKIFEIGYDDYILISINEHVVFVGPDGGTKLEVVRLYDEDRHWSGLKVNNGCDWKKNERCLKVCERGTDWRDSTEIDLLPYLKEGKNKIFMRTVVFGYGEGWIKIKARQHCCNDWKEEWVDDCEEFRK